MPTPEQCRTGQYNGFYDGGAPGRFAVCVARDGRIITYFGGEPATLCGVGLVNDLVVALDEYGRDPNQCSRNSLLSNPMTHTPNLQHVANVPPHPESDAQSHTQSDLAFWGRLAVEGNYGGLRIIDIADPTQPRVLADLECYGPQGDVSVWNDLLMVSIDRPLASTACGAREADVPTLPTNFEGLRVFRISDILAATPGEDGRVHVAPVANVPIDCGSHTNTLVPQLDKDRVLVYVASTGYNPGPRCGPENAALGGYDPLHRKISIIAVPLDAPEAARVIAEPRLDAQIFELEPEEGSHFHRELRPTISCHDISVFLDLKLAAGACLSEAQIWDISDPENPKTLSATRIDNRHVRFWHSASFTWDGKSVVFSDEPMIRSFRTDYYGCRDDSMTGRLWFYRLADTSQPAGSFQIPRNQGDVPCYAHNFNVLPVPGRQVAAVGAYGGGVSVVDFTYPDDAREIAFYDFGAGQGRASDVASAYWYNGLIYANDGSTWPGEKAAVARGFDVYRLSDLAGSAARRFRYLNPQTQIGRLP